MSGPEGSVRIRWVDDVFADGAQPGDAQWLSRGGDGVTVAATGEQVPYREHAAIAYRCPGCNDHRCVPVRLGTEDSRAWQWDGNVASPTLRPSILHRDCACRWHGYLTAGEFVSC